MVQDFYSRTWNSLGPTLGGPKIPDLWKLEPFLDWYCTLGKVPLNRFLPGKEITIFSTKIFFNASATLTRLPELKDSYLAWFWKINHARHHSSNCISNIEQSETPYWNKPFCMVLTMTVISRWSDECCNSWKQAQCYNKNRNDAKYWVDFYSYQISTGKLFGPSRTRTSRTAHNGPNSNGQTI